VVHNSSFQLCEHKNWASNMFHAVWLYSVTIYTNLHCLEIEINKRYDGIILTQQISFEYEKLSIHEVTLLGPKDATQYKLSIHETCCLDDKKSIRGFLNFLRNNIIFYNSDQKLLDVEFVWKIKCLYRLDLATMIVKLISAYLEII
ncbi:hypothetical protein ACJX0J_020183, partial [Zea mays]